MAGLIPQPGQPCYLGDDLYVVAKVGAGADGLVVAVVPHGVRRPKPVWMGLARWRAHFTWPDPPS
jgi:hypothetical protein